MPEPASPAVQVTSTVLVLRNESSPGESTERVGGLASTVKSTVAAWDFPELSKAANVTEWAPSATPVKV